MKKNNAEEQENMIVERIADFFNLESLDFSTIDIKNLIQFAPHVKEIFLKITDWTSNSEKDIIEIFRQAMSIYGDELKRDDLTPEQRESIYSRIDKHVEHAQEQGNKNKLFIRSMLGAVVLGGLTIAGVKLNKR